MTQPSTPDRPAPGWYGKLPGNGDFLRRRLPDGLINSWSHWFQSGIAWQKQQPATGVPVTQFAMAPVWNFIIPAALSGQHIQMGCMLPAQDRVGRQYPICAMSLLTLEEWHPLQLRIAGPWYRQLGMTLNEAVNQRCTADQLDQSLLTMPALPKPDTGGLSDIFDVIGYRDIPGTLNWPQVEEYFNPSQYTSFWWTNQSDGSPLFTHVHSGNFTTRLFSLLFQSANARHTGRNGLYPPMFE
ncbi:type VI secretion system-associated protein TagF [Serratia sp. M24T3]|uniref:Type VI secretion system-associated protein TagF n=1 Tax=Rouxiella sp. WC2420 TaxID=3234145 RepID=A0AB39VUR1_9GAMM|nr:type VI secretion system-associated protein TagF [Serratia sp. M24T3]EIC84119.1 hypothetical protein SPM24T3_13376 [Serratia sp. M24T3]